MPKAKLNGVPGGYEVWGIKPTGKSKNHVLYVVYYVPGTGTKIPMGWKVNADEWQRLSGGSEKKGKVDRWMTKKQAQKAGMQWSGASTELKNLGKHPFDGALADFKKAAKLRPWMKHNEVLALWASAYLEGREIRDSDLKQTNWYKRSSPEQKAWYELRNTEPKAAQRRLEDNRYRVRKALEQAGLTNAPASLVNYWADRFTWGFITEADLQYRIEVGTDPYVRNASVLAGVTSGTLPSSFIPVQHKGRMYIRTSKGDFLIQGKGAQSRFGGIKKAKKVNKVKKVGSNKQLAKHLESIGHGAVVQGEDEVRQIVEDYVGPRQAEGKKNSYYGEWASLIRRDSSAKDRLIKELEKSAAALFQNYGEGTKYSDIAPGYRQMFQEMWGETADETDSFFWNLLQENDAQSAMQQLRVEGIKRGNQIQQQELFKAALQASGNNVRAAI